MNLRCPYAVPTIKNFIGTAMNLLGGQISRPTQFQSQNHFGKRAASIASIRRTNSLQQAARIPQICRIQSSERLEDERSRQIVSASPSLRHSPVDISTGNRQAIVA